MRNRESHKLNESTTKKGEQPASSDDSAVEDALWRLSLVLREIAESLEPRGDKKEPPRQLPTEELTAGDGECRDAEKQDL